MSSVPVAVAVGAVPVVEPGVYEYARKQDVDAPLRRMLEATPDLFPTARSIRVFMEPDPELHDYWFLIFEVQVPAADFPDVPAIRAADRRWGQEFFRASASPVKDTFVLDLIRIKS